MAALRFVGIIALCAGFAVAFPSASSAAARPSLPLTKSALHYATPLRAPPTRRASLISAGATAESPQKNTLLPIWLAVFVQMLGVGVNLSTLPVFLRSAFDATPHQLALVISGFSAAQMLGAPLLVSLSGRIGRLTVLRMCLAGNAMAALLTSVASRYSQVACARVLAGLFAASVPVAQVATAELTPPGAATSKALTRVASATSLGIIAGPAAGGLIAEIASSATGCGTAGASRWVFGASSAFTTIVLLLTSRVRMVSPAAAAAKPAAGSGGSGAAEESATKPSLDAAGVDDEPADAPAYTQLLLRWCAFVSSSAVVVGIATYALFALDFLGYGQREISNTQSATAAASLGVQVRRATCAALLLSTP